jgi:hypothetical protein
MGIFTLGAAVTATGCTWRQCGQITLNSATITNSTISRSTATSAVLAASPADAESVSGTDFTSSGTGHGLEITGTTADMTLTNNTWTDYTAASGGNEAVYVNTTGGTGVMNLTISGGTTPSIRKGAGVTTVNIVESSRTIKVAVTSVDGPVTGANVFLAADAGGPFPYNDSVTISNSGTTATVTHTGHGLAANDKVVISGASLDANNGVFAITLDGADPTNIYTYTMLSAPGSSPTGATSTFVFLKGEATAGTGSNEISMSRAISSDQPVTGWARKSSAQPYYKEGAISGTVSSSGDTTFSPVLINDD